MSIEFGTDPGCSITRLGCVIDFSLETSKPRSPKRVKVSFIFDLHGTGVSPNKKLSSR